MTIGRCESPAAAPDDPRVQQAEPWLDAAPRGHARIPDAAFAGMTRVDDGRGARAVLFDVGVIAATIALADAWFAWWLYPLAVIIIGSRQHALVVLMHEASHEGLFRHRKLNDLVGEVLLAWPFGVSMRSYRDNHIAHHRYLNSTNDPDWRRYRSPGAAEFADWTYPRSSASVLALLAMDLVGLHAADQLRRGSRLGRPRDHRPAEEKQRDADNPVKLPRSWVRARWGIRLGCAVLFTVTGTWLGFFLYWVVPVFTMLKMCIRVRQLAGHFAVYGGEGLRTTLAGPLARFLVSPHHIGFHTEHHLYPFVPWHELDKVHRMMVDRGDYEPGTAFRLTPSYLGVIADWSRDAEAQRRTAYVPPRIARPAPRAIPEGPR